MKKRVVSMLLAVVMMLGMFPGTALAAGSVEEALGEVNIYNGEQKLSYLSINGRVRELIYTYYNYVDRNGQTKEIPAYCVNPNIKGVPQTVAPGESIKYLANEIGSDPKVMGIIANGYQLAVDRFTPDYDYTNLAAFYVDLVEYLVMAVRLYFFIREQQFRPIDRGKYDELVGIQAVLEKPA